MSNQTKHEKKKTYASVNQFCRVSGIVEVDGLLNIDLSDGHSGAHDERSSASEALRDPDEKREEGDMVEIALLSSGRFATKSGGERFK